MTDINYKEGIAKTIENHGATRQSTFVAAEILRYLSSMELPELLLTDEEKAKCVVIFDGEVGITASMDKTAEAQLKKLQPIIAAQIGYREILRDDVVQLQNELDKQIVENEGLKKQLSTARAETAKEIKGKVITSLCPNSISAGQVDVIFSAYLALDKEGGK